MLMDKYQTTKNSKALVLLKNISPVAWQNIHFHGHYTFCGSRHPINLDAMVANLTLEEGGQGYQHCGSDPTPEMSWKIA